MRKCALDASGYEDFSHPIAARHGSELDESPSMSTFELPPDIQHLAHDLLAWVGYGTLVGLLAKAIMPGRDPGGAVATLAMGIGGSVIGCGALMYISDGIRVTPLSPVGFVVATMGAFILLFFYRLLGGRYDRYRSVGIGRAPYYSSRRPRVERIIEE
jgi:uncharacterized membrane protein YeaQ/YmgE (transglycosylase-associated protein family)